jgi:hypothetical protein
MKDAGFRFLRANIEAQIFPTAEVNAPFHSDS